MKRDIGFVRIFLQQNIYILCLRTSFCLSDDISLTVDEKWLTFSVKLLKCIIGFSINIEEGNSVRQTLEN